MLFLDFMLINTYTTWNKKSQHNPFTLIVMIEAWGTNQSMWKITFQWNDFTNAPNPNDLNFHYILQIPFRLALDEIQLLSTWIQNITELLFHDIIIIQILSIKKMIRYCHWRFHNISVQVYFTFTRHHF